MEQMGKTVTINLSVDSSLVTDAETILMRLGISLPTAINIFLNQVVLTQGIPFPVILPKPSSSIDASQITQEQFHTKLQKGYDDYKAGRVKNAQAAFDVFRQSHK